MGPMMPSRQGTRFCQRDGGKVNHYELLRVTERPFDVKAFPAGGKKASTSIVIRRGALRDILGASRQEHTPRRDQQAQVHLRRGSAIGNGTAARASDGRSVSTTLVQSVCPLTGAALNLPGAVGTFFLAALEKRGRYIWGSRLGET